MKTLLLLLSLPLAASAQKMEATSSPRTFYVGKEKAPLYRFPADTAGKPNTYLYPSGEAVVVGDYSPRWAIVKHTGYLYLVQKQQLSNYLPLGSNSAKPQVADAPAAVTSSAGAPHTKASTLPRTEEYCMILASAKFLSTKVIISIDYGQERSLFADNRYRDDQGKVQSFNSVIDALNFQNAQGWEFVNAYSITVGTQNVYHYVMKRHIAQ